MKAITHKHLARHLTDRFLSKCTDIQISAFVFGCIQPDKNPTSYIKGSFKQKILHGHNWLNAKSYIKKLCRDLNRNRPYSILDYYKLGKLIHYASDAFTYTHNQYFQGNLAKHRSYEQTLNKLAIAVINEHINSGISYEKELFSYIQQLHCKYLKKHPCTATDIYFILAVTEQIMQRLV